MKKQLYPWQEDCLKTWFDNDCRGIIRAVTGSGKTLLAISAIKKLRRRLGDSLRVKIVVPQTAIAAQWFTALKDDGEITRTDIGFYYSGRKDFSDRFCMIYVINSARYTLARHILQDLSEGKQIFLIADECHHYASPENRKIFEFLPFLKNFPNQYFAIGLSATPRTFGWKEYLMPAIGDEIYNYTFEDAAKNQTISPFAILHVSVPLNPVERKKYAEFEEQIAVITKKLIWFVPELKKLHGDSYFRAVRHIASDER
ncbi:MAG: DEAD/DEAH box helicase family protein, partial [Clostridiales bacterium]|nr:DEAD/DEAH box helicase family protein [Clostridiales bacterium]